MWIGLLQQPWIKTFICLNAGHSLPELAPQSQNWIHTVATEKGILYFTILYQLQEGLRGFMHHHKVEPLCLTALPWWRVPQAWRHARCCGPVDAGTSVAGGSRALSEVPSQLPAPQWRWSTAQRPHSENQNDVSYEEGKGHSGHLGETKVFGRETKVFGRETVNTGKHPLTLAGKRLTHESIHSLWWWVDV